MSRLSAVYSRAAWPVGILFCVWIGFLFWQTAPPTVWTETPQRLPKVRVGSEQLLARLTLLRETLEAQARATGGYPSTQGGWMQVDDATQTAFQTESLRPLAAADKDEEQILYRSDGKDYKLIAHQSSGETCVQLRSKHPERIDLARITFRPGLQPGPGWTVREQKDIENVELFMQQRGEPVQHADPRLSRMMTGFCWAFGYWTQGAQDW